MSIDSKLESCFLEVVQAVLPRPTKSTNGERKVIALCFRIILVKVLFLYEFQDLLGGRRNIIRIRKCQPLIACLVL